jgi:hypothetical protein
MSRTRTATGLPLWSLKGLLLACLAVSCSVPDGLMLNISVPSGTQVKSYVIKVQDRSTRKVVFLSGLQHVAAGRDLSSDPLRVAMPFNQRGSFLVQVLAANVDNVEDLPQQGVTEPQLFFARILDVSVLQQLDVPLLPVAPDYDTDGDHFPDAVRWLAAVPQAMAMYAGTPEVLDCVDGDPPPGDISPVRTRGFDIHPLAQPQCNVMLRPAHSPTANPLPPLAPLDITCAGQPRACVDKDGDGDPEGSDCDDTDPNRFHGNPRPRNCCQCTDPKSCATNHAKLDNMMLCNPKRCDTAYDYDCTGLNVPCFIDEDCDGYAANDTDPKLRDCDDTDARVHPGADKICDPPDGVIKDWACDGRPQAGCVPCDLDGDGYQRAEVIGAQTCPTTNYKMAGRPIDCDDNDRGVFPGALTYQGSASMTRYGSLDQSSRGYNLLAAMRGLCRNKDARGMVQNTNCDSDPSSARLGCPSAACDADGDGYPNNTVGCLVVGKPVDCDDSDPTAFPGAPLHCDGKDHDCDGAADKCSFDRDGDGYDSSGDCDDNNAAVHPFAAEMCNGVDDDCDGLIDEQNPDSAGHALVQTGTDSSTRITSCADSTVGLCGKQDSAGFYTGRCVCTSVTPNSTVNPAAVAHCPAENDSAAFTARCFGANQPQPQSCDADNPVDDDCNGDLSDPTGNNLAQKGQICGLDVTALGAPCRKGTVLGCDRNRVNPFYALGVPGFASKDRFLVCKNQTDPVAEKCNGYDDDCNGQLPINEQDLDGDKFMACSGCTNVNDAASFNQNLLYCNDCDDHNRTVYPPIPGANSQFPTGAEELCDGLDNKCVSGSSANTPANDGIEQCGSGTDVGKPNCCSSLMQCVDKMTDFSHCGSCSNQCSTSTADRCSSGMCMCKLDPACDPTSTTKSMCKAGSGCVQCLADADCPRLLGAATTTKSCGPSNTCVECTSNKFCTDKTRPVCDLTTDRCVPCLSNSDCTSPGMQACSVNKNDSTQNQCVRCAADTDCKVAPLTHCKIDAVTPSNNTCVQCQTNNDCSGTTPVCDTTANSCVACLADADCGAGKKCLTSNISSSLNKCVQCISSADCAGVAGKPACATALNMCVACLSNADCAGVAGKPACSVNADPTKNQCVACLSSADCAGVAGKPACSTNADPSKNMCVACLSSADCATVPGDPGCYIDPTPDPSKNLCVPCASNADCKAPTPTCKKVTNPANDVCVVCLANADCPATTPVCDKNANDDTKNVCTACLVDTDCKLATLPKCLVNAADATQNSCVACLTDKDCQGKMTCNAMNMCM